MHLATPASAIMSAVIFNAIIIILLIPLSLRGVKYRALGASRLLRDHALIYGVGGVIAPFIGIKAIDMLLVACIWSKTSSPAAFGGGTMDPRLQPRG